MLRSKLPVLARFVAILAFVLMLGCDSVSSNGGAGRSTPGEGLDITGHYTGSTSFFIDQTTCDNPLSIVTSASMDLSGQDGGPFHWLVTNTTTFEGSSFVEEMDLRGMMSGEGLVTGTYAERLFINGQLDSGGDGVFEGSFDGTTLHFDFSGQDTLGGTCRISGSTIVTR